VDIIPCFFLTEYYLCFERNIFDLVTFDFVVCILCFMTETHDMPDDSRRNTSTVLSICNFAKLVLLFCAFSSLQFNFNCERLGNGMNWRITLYFMENHNGAQLVQHTFPVTKVFLLA